MNLVVDCLRRPASFDQLKNVWQTLERLDPLCSPFLSWSYLSGWWQATGSNQGKLRILVVRRGKEVVAIAPLYIQQEKILKAIDNVTLKIMGRLEGIEPVHHGVIAQPKMRAKACDAILDYLPTMKAWHSLSFDGLDSTSKFSTLASRKIISNKKGATQLRSRSPIQFLPSSWDEYKSFGGGIRVKELSRISASLKRVGDCELTLCSTKEEFKKNLQFLKQFAEGSTSQAENSATTSPFYSQFIMNGFLSDALWQVALTIDGETVGVQHYSIERGNLILLQAGYAASFKDTGVGEYMLAYAIKRGIDQTMFSVHSVVNDGISSSLMSDEHSVCSIRFTRAPWRRALEPLFNRLTNR